MLSEYDMIQETAAFLRGRWAERAEIGIVLGTGLGNLIHKIEVDESIPYEEILPVLKESGFDGYLICEYEDEMYCGGTEFTRKQLAMEKRILQG